jgi:hypothetical protein
MRRTVMLREMDRALYNIKEDEREGRRLVRNRQSIRDLLKDALKDLELGLEVDAAESIKKALEKL